MTVTFGILILVSSCYCQSFGSGFWHVLNVLFNVIRHSDGSNFLQQYLCNPRFKTWQ